MSLVHVLEFLNPLYHLGDNVTIRMGDKWYRKASVFDLVNITQTGTSKPLATGVIREMWHIPFKEVTISHLWDEHDPECRNPDGLVKAMLRAYPRFTLEDSVTVIRFEIKNS